jgi:F0F1-type ATP synthase assembly protein I
MKELKQNLITMGIYTIFFGLLLIPFVTTVMQAICGGLILGFFAGLLNDLRKCNNCEINGQERKTEETKEE